METLEAGGVGSDESEIRSTCNGGERGGLEAVCIYLQYVETRSLDGLAGNTARHPRLNELRLAERPRFHICLYHIREQGRCEPIIPRKWRPCREGVTEAAPPLPTRQIFHEKRQK